MTPKRLYLVNGLSYSCSEPLISINDLLRNIKNRAVAMAQQLIRLAPVLYFWSHVNFAITTTYIWIRM